MEFIVPETVSVFRNDTDADLLGYMAMRNDDPETATEAYAEFYSRHVRWLYARLTRSPIQRILGGPECVPEFVQDTFQRAFEQAGTFDAAGITDGMRLRNRARAWLGVIGNRIMVDATRPVASGQYEVPIGDIEHELRVVDCDSMSPEVEAVREVLEELDERERDVLLEWGVHYKPGVAHQRLPNTESTALARRWGTTPEHIRVIRKRAMDKLRAEVPKRLADRQKQ